MDYYEARRRARAILGGAADVQEEKGVPGKLNLFPCRIGVWVKHERAAARFVIVAAKGNWEEALKEAHEKQALGAST